MGNPVTSKIGDYIKALVCGLASLTAAGTGDNTAVTGATIDRRGYGSAHLVIQYKTTLTDTKTLAFAVEYQESDDGSTWDTATALQASTVALTGSSSTNALGKVEFDVDLSLKKRYIRFNYTPDLNNSGTDTAVTSATCVLGGATTKPAA
jgi:hypothetical protein